MKNLNTFFIGCFVICTISVQTMAQRPMADSVFNLLQKETVDSNKVRLMWQLADFSNLYAPDSSLMIAQNALFLARKINYAEGESRALGIIANTFLKIGNYTRALDYYLRKLQLEEKRNDPRSLASVTMNIGIVYAYESDYSLALKYYMKADSIIRLHNVSDFKYNISLNIGDLYDRLNNIDSAFLYYDRSLQIALKNKDNIASAISMVGLANTYRNSKLNDLAKIAYLNALPLLKAGNEDDIICESYLGLAKIYQEAGQLDSAQYFAELSLNLAQKDEFLGRQLDAASFLTQLSKSNGLLQKAFNYLQLTQSLKDSIYSKDKIRESLILSSNEKERQLALEQTRLKAAEERSQQLQYLFISIFIPAVFLITLLLSRRKVRPKLVRFLGVISLLFLFEFLTLLLHPKVVELTNHNPILELIIFVAIAAFIIPTHHRIEHWLIEKLTFSKSGADNFMLKLRTIKLRIKKPSR